METTDRGSPASFLLQTDRQGWSQTRLMIPGKGTVFFRILAASVKFPAAACAIMALTSTWTGQAAAQLGGCSWMHLSSSLISSSFSMVPQNFLPMNATRLRLCLRALNRQKVQDRQRLPTALPEGGREQWLNVFRAEDQPAYS